jgi:hypothetical protein
MGGVASADAVVSSESRWRLDPDPGARARPHLHSTRGCAPSVSDACSSLPQLRHPPPGQYMGPVPHLHTPPALRFLAARARPLPLAAAETGGEAPGRKPLRPLWLDSPALRSPCRRWIERARGSPHALWSLPCKRTCARIIPGRQSLFLRESAPRPPPGRRQFRPEAAD